MMMMAILSISVVIRSYDPEDGLWREVREGKAFLPHEREKHNMVPIGNSKILVLAGRGFDQETFSEKDEGAVCHYNLGGVEYDKAVGGLKPEWDLDHPGMPHPRSNAAILLLGRNVWAIGGLSYNKGTGVNTVGYYDIKRRRWREAFPLPEGHYSNLDGVLLHIPVTNKDFCFVDRFIYDRWIMW
ncbi:kelch-like protein 9 [Elysia marginata]|uniref:Kelch-like protein 9 n=1 Tax=Elysia marginata TaxID=1093978 RepID=A0AAV4J532_9GAST|nr:kelch-like protein 9 [Elysia marginata]